MSYRQIGGHARSGQDQDQRTANQRSSMHGLPVEIWAEIFSLCMTDDGFVTPSPSAAPLLLCQVCGIWRDIAIGTPYVWSSLAIRLHDGSDATLWNEAIGTWLKRSSNSSIHLDISLPKTNLLRDAFDFAPLTSTAHRWRHLKLEMSDDVLDKILIHPMPNLHSIEIVHFHHEKCLILDETAFPNLQSVSYPTPVELEQRVSLPWHKIKHLSSPGLANIKTHTQILRMCPTLDSYVMTLFFADTPPSAKSVILPYLRKLHILAWVPGAIGVFLNQLILPSLDELMIEVCGDGGLCRRSQLPKDDVLSLLERSSSSPRTLYIKNMDASPECLHDIRKAIPSLKDLSIS